MPGGGYAELPRAPKREENRNQQLSIVARRETESSNLVLSEETPVEIDNDMSAIIDFLIRVSEEMLIHLVMYSCTAVEIALLSAFKRLRTIRWIVISQ